MRRLESIALPVALGLLLASCGSSTPGGAAGSAPVVPSVAAASNDSESPTDETQPSAGGGGGGGSIPTIADGRYKGGTAHIEVSGDVNETLDAALSPVVSITTSGLTALTYSTGSATTQVVVNVVFNPDTGPAISYQSAKVLAAGGVSEGCHVELTKNDASGLAGTFSCSGLEGLAPGAVDPAKVDLKGTYSADR